MLLPQIMPRKQEVASTSSQTLQLTDSLRGLEKMRDGQVKNAKQSTTTDVALNLFVVHHFQI